MKPVVKMLSIGAALMMALVACNKNEIPSPSTAGMPGNAGTFKVRMTDSPTDFASLDAQITGVSAYLDGTGWVSLNAQAQTVNVLSLQNGVETTLAFDANAAAGHYSQLQITFGDQNELTLHAGTQLALVGLNGSSTFDLAFANPGDNEVTIAIDATVSADQGADLLVDFNVASSIEQSGNSFVFEPALQIIAHPDNGIRGDIHGAASALVQLNDGSASITTYADANGNFLLRGMADGTYSITIHGLVDNMGVMTEATTTIDGIIVADGEITNMGAISL